MKKINSLDSKIRPIITEKQGNVKFVDVNKETLEEITSVDTGMTSQLIKEWKGISSICESKEPSSWAGLSNLTLPIKAEQSHPATAPTTSSAPPASALL